MSYVSLLLLFACIVSASMGVAVLMHKPLTRTIKSFSWLCFGLSIWSISELGLSVARSPEEAWWWQKALIFWPIPVASMMVFVVVFVERTELLRKPWFFSLVFLPAATLFGLGITTDIVYTTPIKMSWGYSYGLPKYALVGMMDGGWILFCCFFSSYLLARFYFTSKDHAKKQQAKLYLIGVSFTIIAGVIYATLFLDGIRIPPISVMSLNITCVFLTYAIFEYDLFALTPVAAAYNIFSTMTDALFLLTTKGNILWTNNAVKLISGYEPDELTALSILTLFKGGNEPEWLTKALRERPTRVAHVETIMLGKNGDEIPVSLSCSLLYDKKKSIQGLLIIARDISDLKKTEQERRKLEAQFHAAQKMEAIGRLAGGVAHDLNNMLCAITTSAALHRQTEEHSAAGIEDIDTILKAATRGSELTKNLLGFARKGTYVKAPVDLNEVVEEIQSLLIRTIDKRIAITTRLTDGLHKVTGDRSQLFHALTNICINACDAISGNGNVVIEAANVSLTPSDLKKSLELVPGPYVELRVIDTGSGMTPETQNRIFEPFYTTKAVGEGSGLGLSMVYGVIKSHDGAIQIESTLGKGTEVRLLLPADKEKVEHSAVLAKKEIPAKNRENLILLVDDEELIRRSTPRVLKKLGYRVLTAEDGADALEVYRENREVIDLIILDLIMPRMDGATAFRELKKIDPMVRVLLVSGYSMDSTVEELLDSGAKGFLHKPFDIEELLGNVERILSASPPV